MTVTFPDLTPELDPALPRTERLSIELKRRKLTVKTTQRLTPHMQRVTLTGEDLADFESPGFDDNVKLLFDMGEGEPARRSYTPRAFNRKTRELVLDFALHDAGPATKWALQAGIGDTLMVGGPRGSRVVHGGSKRWLLIGDETALPAMGRKIEEAASGEEITMIAGVPGPEDHQTFDTKANLTCRWLYRDEANAAAIAPFLNAIKAMTLEPDTFIWIAAEAAVAQAIKGYMLGVLGINPAWLRSAGYWIKGAAGK